MIATWYVMEDGSVGDPADVRADDAGVLRHQDGRVVAMRADVPRSRSIDVNTHREMRPQSSGPGYVTRGSPGPPDPDADLTAARAEYHAAFDKRPFAGWDITTLRQKIAEKAG